jgi:hypothetical protein
MRIPVLRGLIDRRILGTSVSIRRVETDLAAAVSPDK